MARISIRSVGGDVTIKVDGQDITEHVLADPWPVVQVAPASNPSQSRITLTLTGELDLEVDGEVNQ